ncbi:MAG: hypothetical protein KKG00_01755, partial [Bacteroidetes bacterium]|nr:hypothetical protein [Bacteroidota bacterium]
MIKSKSLPLIAYSVLTIIWLYTFYVSVLAPPFFGYFTVDENFVADSGVFLWYGNTPRCLDWPATPSVLIFFVMFGVMIVYQTLSGMGEVNQVLDLFEGIDRVAYGYISSRQELLLAGRTIQLIIVGAVMWLFIRFLFQKQHSLLNDTSRMVLTVLILTSYILWFNAPVLRPEAISGSIFMYLLARLLFSDTLRVRDSYFLAVLFGIILAERLLFVFIAPLV